MVCYGAGLRVSEAVALKVSDVDSKRMLIRVEQGKGKKDRYAMLSERLLHVLRRYWVAVKSTEYLFPSWCRGRYLSPASLQQACRDAANAAGASQEATPLTPCGTMPGSGLFRVQEIEKAKGPSMLRRSTSAREITRHSFCYRFWRKVSNASPGR